MNLNIITTPEWATGREWFFFRRQHPWSQENPCQKPPEEIRRKMRREFLSANPEHRAEILAHPEFKGM